jgi:hypothetical protein
MILRNSSLPVGSFQASEPSYLAFGGCIEDGNPSKRPYKIGAIYLLAAAGFARGFKKH